MFKHLWVERGMLSGLIKKNLHLVIVINNEPILSSMLAAGIVKDTFAGKAGKSERGRRSATTGGYFYHPGRKFFPFLSQITNARARVLETYVSMYTILYENLDLDVIRGVSLRSTDKYR